MSFRYTVVTEHLYGEDEREIVNRLQLDFGVTETNLIGEPVRFVCGWFKSLSREEAKGWVEGCRLPVNAAIVTEWGEVWPIRKFATTDDSGSPK